MAQRALSSTKAIITQKHRVLRRVTQPFEAEQPVRLCAVEGQGGKPETAIQNYI